MSAMFSQSRKTIRHWINFLWVALPSHWNPAEIQADFLSNNVFLYPGCLLHIAYLCSFFYSHYNLCHEFMLNRFTSRVSCTIQVWLAAEEAKKLPIMVWFSTLGPLLACLQMVHPYTCWWRPLKEYSDSEWRGWRQSSWYLCRQNCSWWAGSLTTQKNMIKKICSGYDLANTISTEIIFCLSSFPPHLHQWRISIGKFVINYKHSSV